MPNTAKKRENLEILISTKNRNSLDFLNSMFPLGKYDGYQILIINQTTESNTLTSNSEHIRVINSFETGLSRSRNLALEHAQGDICLIADDDVTYTENFDQYIYDAFVRHKGADIITFKMVDEHGRDFKTYPNTEIHDKKSISSVNSVVIAFRRESLVNSPIRFNPLFGLGGTFQTGDEYVFLRNALDENLKLFFEPSVILSHPFNSSGRDSGSDRLVFGRAGIYAKYSGSLAYLRVVKYVYLIFRRGHINANQILPKLATGFKAVSAYKRMAN